MKLILGNGKTAQSIARFFSKQSILFTLIEDSRKIKDLNILAEIEEIITSPGIPQTQKIITSARSQNIPVISDIELFSRYAKAPIIAITGSNGKSTVTKLLGEMISKNGNKVAVGGNIGTPALDCLQNDIEFYVLELSSYQLDYTQNLSLITATVLNITPDHLERYKSFADYKKSKLSIYKYCQKPVFNLDENPSKNASGFSLKIPAKPSDFGIIICHDNSYFVQGDKVLMSAAETKLIGAHSQQNILAALALGSQINLKTSAMIAAIKAFKGLEHRLEWVCKKDNINYYNDSKSTNSASTIAAINALIPTNNDIALILGGIQKQEDYTSLFALINQSIKIVILIGESTPNFAPKITTKTTHAKSIQDATHIAQSLINNGIILLSPACASFDMFDNFEHRGQVFKDCVN
ncbi:MAG: UDP-N-acetylmuramoyl-L-alanine--D-glutamate ligase [Candidatus Thioglobus sp.]|nr:MAG: UDP-N-acetylmuramoyl-L-alanine--D-glutamate ligase [Candidatus Thioglobus sp.]KAA0450942.1 MAG: UDP-N-acetylmuramoyl-L-alanine--D-glutamate ligase [Candidatus Thioglobus sp.]